eukprot:403358847
MAGIFSGTSTSKSYDFSQIFTTQQDIKSSFRNLNVSHERLQKGIYKSHDRFFKKLIKDKRQTVLRDLQSYITDSKNKDNEKKQNKDNKNGQYIIESGANQMNSKQAKNIVMESMKQIDNNFEGNVLIENQLTFIEVDDFKKQKLQQQLQYQLQLHQFLKKQGMQGALQQINNQQSQSNIPIALNRFSLIYPPNTGPLKVDNYQFKNMDEFNYLVNFKDEILEPEEKAMFIREDVNSEELKIAKNILCNRGNDLKSVKIHEFRKYMENEKILEHCSQLLYDSILLSDRQDTAQSNFQQRNQHFQTNVSDIKDLLKTIDKYLFIMFRNQEITLDQLKARIAEKNLNVKYVVLDDLRKTLQPDILEGVPDEILYNLYRTETTSDGRIIVPLKEMQKGLQPWQTDNRCLRSMFYHKKKQDSQNSQGKFGQSFGYVSPLKRLNVTDSVKNEKSNFESNYLNGKLKSSARLLSKPNKDQNSKEQLIEHNEKSRNTNEFLKRNNTTTNKTTSEMSKTQQSTNSKGVKYRLPVKYEVRDYKQFVSVMTNKIKSELQKEILKQDQQQKNEVLRESFSTKKDQMSETLLDQIEPSLISLQKTSSNSPMKNSKKNMFQASNKSYTLKHIREKLDQESQKVQGMLFLKQLELEGKGQVVWEKSTLDIMLQMAEEKFKLENTDYERALKPRKPRPQDVIKGFLVSQNQGEIQESDLNGSAHKQRNSYYERNANSSQIYSPYKNIEKSKSLIKIEEESVSNQDNTQSRDQFHYDYKEYSLQKTPGSNNCYQDHTTVDMSPDNNIQSQEHMIHNFIISSEKAQKLPSQLQSQIQLPQQNTSQMRGNTTQNLLTNIQGQQNSYRNLKDNKLGVTNNVYTHQSIHRQEKNMTTATSISNDEYLISNINSNRSLLMKNPPQFYHPNQTTQLNYQQQLQLQQKFYSNNNLVAALQNQSLNQLTVLSGSQSIGQAHTQHETANSYVNNSQIVITNQFPLRTNSSHQVRRQNVNNQQQNGNQLYRHINLTQKPQTADNSNGGRRPKHQNHRKLHDFRITQRLAQVLVQNEIPVQLNQTTNNFSTDFEDIQSTTNASTTAIDRQQVYSQKHINPQLRNIQSGSSVRAGADISSKRALSLKQKNLISYQQKQAKFNFTRNGFNSSKNNNTSYQQFAKTTNYSTTYYQSSAETGTGVGITEQQANSVGSLIQPIALQFDNLHIRSNIDLQHESQQQKQDFKYNIQNTSHKLLSQIGDKNKTQHMQQIEINQQERMNKTAGDNFFNPQNHCNSNIKGNFDINPQLEYSQKPQFADAFTSSQDNLQLNDKELLKNKFMISRFKRLQDQRDGKRNRLLY